MMNKKKMKRLTVVLVICTMLMNGIAVFPLSAEEAILPETVNEEPAAVETAPAEEPTEEEGFLYWELKGRSTVIMGYMQNGLWELMYSYTK